MVSRTVTFCDMCSEDDNRAERTVTWAIDGAEYEMDLCPQHLQDWDSLERSREQFRVVSRQLKGEIVPTSTRRGSNGSSRTDRQTLEAIRHWAKENGYQVSERGRLPRSVREAYQKAMDDFEQRNAARPGGQTPAPPADVDEGRPEPEVALAVQGS